MEALCTKLCKDKYYIVFRWDDVLCYLQTLLLICSQSLPHSDKVTVIVIRNTSYILWNPLDNRTTATERFNIALPRFQGSKNEGQYIFDYTLFVTQVLHFVFLDLIVNVTPCLYQSSLTRPLYASILGRCLGTMVNSSCSVVSMQSPGFNSPHLFVTALISDSYFSDLLAFAVTTGASIVSCRSASPGFEPNREYNLNSAAL